jgi:hypothetical protein
MKNYVIFLFPCFYFISCFSQQTSEPVKTVFEQAKPTQPVTPVQQVVTLPSLPTLPILEQQAKAIKTIGNILTLKHTSLFHIEATYSAYALTDLESPAGSPIQIKNPQLTGIIAYDIPNKITFQGDFTTNLHFYNDQESLLSVTFFLENLTNPANFNTLSQEWIQTTIPNFIYKVKFVSGGALTIDRNVLESFLQRLLQKIVAKWRRMITEFKINIREQKLAIASIPSNQADQEKVQQIINKLDAVFTQLIPF